METASPPAFTGPSSWRERGLAATGVLVIVASFIHYLSSHDYPLLRPEVVASVLGLALAGAVAGALYLKASPIMRAVADAALVFLAVDINANNLLLAAGLAASALLAALVLRRSALPVMAVTFAVGLLVDLSGNLSRAANAQPLASVQPGAALRPVVHIILDEHIGIEGLPDVPGAAELRSELASFYAQRGFQMAGGAYSEHLHTVNSIPQILNFGRDQPPRPDQKSAGVALSRNAWFDDLARRGYRIRVHQSDFVDYCRHAAVVDCQTYPVAGVRDVANASLTTQDKAELALFDFLSLADTIETATQLYDLAAWSWGLPRIALDFRRRTSTLNAYGAFDRLIADLAQVQPGHVYFAHILAPHYPYAVDSSCRLLPARQWIMRQSPLPIAERNAAYFDQIRCTTRRLAAALDALASTPAGRDAIVIVHGDHGSRITQVDPKKGAVGRFDDHDMIAAYATLFAVRAPRMVAGYDDRRAPVGALLRTFAQSDMTHIDVPSGRPSIVLDDFNWQPSERVALAPSWTASVAR